MIKRFVILQDEQLVVRELTQAARSCRIPPAPRPAPPHRAQLAPPPFHVAAPPPPSPPTDDDDEDEAGDEPAGRARARTAAGSPTSRAKRRSKPSAR